MRSKNAGFLPGKRRQPSATARSHSRRHRHHRHRHHRHLRSPGLLHGCSRAVAGPGACGRQPPSANQTAEGVDLGIARPTGGTDTHEGDSTVELSSVLKPAMTLVATFGIALMGPTSGVAGAKPLDPVINTTCTYDQIVAALRIEAPDLASALDAHPEAQTKLREFVALSPEQRRARVDQRLNAHPEWRTTLEQKRATPQGQEKEQMLLRIADTCHNYA